MTLQLQKYCALQKLSMCDILGISFSAVYSGKASTEEKLPDPQGALPGDTQSPPMYISSTNMEVKCILQTTILH